MFMYGADNQTPELRPSEFKGMMRFWWRAVKADDNIISLKDEESKIFGGVDENSGKSKVKLRISYRNLPIGQNVKNDFRISSTYDGRTLKGKDAGISYLLYSTFLRGGKRYIKPNFTFDIFLSSLDTKAYKHALASLWLAIYMGGFGTRARRGGGNIVVEKFEGDNDLDLDFIPRGEDVSSVEKWISKNICKIRTIGLANNLNRTFKYSTLSNFWKVLKPSGDWIKALNSIGEVFRVFRDKNRSEIFKMGVFGMPIVHRRSKTVIVPYRNKKELSRFSSPLIFKVIKSQDKFFPMVIKLNTEFCDVGKKGSKKFQRADTSKLDEFISEIDKGDVIK